MEYPHGLKVDSKMPYKNLSTNSKANESIRPVNSVHKLHNIHAEIMMPFLLKLSDRIPEKTPQMEYDAVNASPESNP
jgi:hypothetical protein